MPLLGKAAVAMWWNVAEEHLSEFHEWHSKEHLPERLAIPGFERGSRWQRENSGAFFVIYELTAYEVLVSEAYRARLNNPTRWSTTMMPLHRDMVRSQCRVAASYGRGLATFMRTIRLSPEDGRADQLEQYLRQALSKVPERFGVTGAHLLRTETPSAPATREQQIRGADAAADWIVLVPGHNEAALKAVCSVVLGREALRESGAAAVDHDEPFRLVHALVPQDV
ncbi:hypothetical protein [Mesorhizobium xinjiangense]|uniref:hypothetical protein n=1 Tax=Mesorhizobium xinjiangense TaxID=2678685 RepID=UPI0012EE9352|nr:hypothetical protein [Mesorhizobium xinjiangense]